jgi:hypothetical protein
VNFAESNSRKIAWGPWIVGAFGCVMFLLGVGRYFFKHRFGLTDAVYCFLAVVPTYLLLLVFDYVTHHARLVSVVLLVLAGVLCFSSPVFDIALGVVLIGAVVVPVLSDWKNEKRQRKSTTANGGGNNERR